MPMETPSITYAWSMDRPMTVHHPTTDDPGDTITCTATATDTDGGTDSALKSATVLNLHRP